MNSATGSRVLSLDEAAAYRPHQVVDLSRELAVAKHQIAWFKRQIFGQKSERRIVDGADGQMSLGEAITQDQVVSPPPPTERPVAAHTRRQTSKKPDTGDDSLPFFDDSRVPVEVIELCAPEAEGLAPEEFEIIGHKDSYRLAQRPGSYVVLNYRRPVIKIKATRVIVSPSAPVGVIEGSRADVSFVAGLLIDKFAYHLPFYRQHQRLADGVRVGIKALRSGLPGRGGKFAQSPPRAVLVAALEADGVDRAPSPGRGVQRIHQVPRHLLMRDGEVEPGEAHRLRALDGRAEVFRADFAGEVAPVKPERGQAGILHRRRSGVPDGIAIHGAKARAGVYGLPKLPGHAVVIGKRRQSSKAKVCPFPHAPRPAAGSAPAGRPAASPFPALLHRAPARMNASCRKRLWRTAASMPGAKGAEPAFRPRLQSTTS